MRNIWGAGLFFLVALMLLSGCDAAGPDVNEGLIGPPSAVGEAPETAGTCATIGGYQVCLTSAQYDATASTTTFLYTVTPSGATAHLRSLTFAYETCTVPLVLNATLPEGATTTADETTGVTSVLFDAMQRRNETKTYSLTFAGAVATGVAQAQVALGSSTSDAWLSGPACEPITWEITGSVYVESDAASNTLYGTRETGEAGIEKVTVVLTDASGNAALDADGSALQAMTDQDGAFSFSKVLSGTYRVVVPASTSAPEDCPSDCSTDYNETLYLEETAGPLYLFSHQEALSLPSGLAAVAVSVGPDAHFDLGFAPEVNAVVAALGGRFATLNELPFTHFLPLLAGLATPEDLSKKRLPSYGVPIEKYLFQFLGKTYDPSLDRTTYAYSLERKGNGGNDVSHVTFGVEDCTPIAYEPERISFGLDPTTGVTGAKFDFGVKRRQTYLLHFTGEVEPGVIDVGVKYGTNVAVVQMPGACANGIGTEVELLESLDNVYFGGTNDPNFLFLQDPLVLPQGKTELKAALDLLLISNPAQNSLEHLEQLLLVSLLIYDLGLGTPNPGFDATLFQFVEPIILEVSQNQTSGKVVDIQAGTGGSGAGGSVLGSYAR